MSDESPISSAADSVTRAARVAPIVIVVLEIVLATLATFLLVAWVTLHDRRFDVTPTKEHSLSDQSVRAAARVSEDVEITIFSSPQEDERRRHVEDVLGRFQRASNHIQGRIVDLDRNPALAREAGVFNYFAGVLRGGGRTVRMRDVDEGEITSALIRFVEGEERRVLFILGHGEADPADADPRSGLSIVAKSMEAENWTILRSDDLRRGIADDVALVVAAGPRHDLTAEELAAIDAHLSRGGGFLLLQEAPTPRSILAWLRPLGIVPGDDLVIDDRNRLAGSDQSMVRVAIYNQEILDMSAAPPAVLPIAQSVAVTDPTRSGAKSEPIAFTGEETWADPDRRALQGAAVDFRNGRDRRGPVPIASIANPGGEHDGSVVVVGDADFATNLYVGLLGNRDLALNLAAVAARAEQLVSVRDEIQPGGTFSRVYLTDAQSRVLFLWSVVVPPFAVAAVGIWIAWRRGRATAG